MLTIQPVNHIYTKNNIHNIHSNNSKPQQIFSDNISFKGIIIRQAKNETEVKELVNLFYNAIKHNIEPDKKTFKLFEKVERYLCTLPFLTVAKKPSSITEIVKSDNKLAGGYSININIPDSTAHIGL